MHDIKLVKNEPTRRMANLDLLPTTNPKLIPYAQIGGSIFNTDHEGIYYNMVIPMQKTSFQKIRLEYTIQPISSK